MEWIYLILLVLLSITGFFIGFCYVGPMKSRWWVLVAVLSIAVIGLYTLFHFYPALEYHLIPNWLGSFTEVIGFVPFATLFLGIAAKRVKGEYLPYELAILALILCIYGVRRVDWLYSGPGIDLAKFSVNEEDICLQSTGYTCGPASAVTLLRHFGIESTEIEMAKLSHTSKWLGVKMVPLARAITSKGLTVDIITADYDTLRHLKEPCLVDIRWSLMIDHMIVLLKAGENEVLIADPLSGLERWSRAKFLNRWRGSAIVVK